MRLKIPFRVSLFMILPAALAAGTVLLLAMTVRSTKAPAEKLSDYGLFVGKLSDLKPAPGVIPYALNTPLFSDYAEKARFIRMPEGSVIPYNDSIVFDFPHGTVLVKNFFYPKDFRKPAGAREIIETRILLRDAQGWKALPYIWNKEQTEAYLDVAGETREVSYIDAAGKTRRHRYDVPNMNQCKGCHNYRETMVPIGPSARQLNGLLDYGAGPENQLDHWASLGLIRDLSSPADRPAGVRWDDPASGSLNDRARAWLDINCGHCHRQGGPASTSGLYLTVHEKDPLRLGIGKTPVAAGRGSGNLQYSIEPGQPDRSILLYRIQSTDPGVMMPELGRSLTHQEGVSLVRDWIRQMQ